MKNILRAPGLYYSPGLSHIFNVLHCISWYATAASSVYELDDSCLQITMHDHHEGRARQRS